MGTASTVLVVSDKQEDILNFRSKLVLLRDIDSIIGIKTDKTLEACKKYVPDAVIFFIDTNKDSVLDICKQIKKDSILKNVPILFILQKFDQETILSGFDMGMSDFLVLPAHESEILIRVIWSLQKSESEREIEKKETLLVDLGVVEKTTEAYTSEYISKVATNEINTALKYKSSLSIMEICLDKDYQSKTNLNILAVLIKKCIRKCDILGVPEKGRFYLILPKTKTQGACILYERISSALGGEITISAGVCELYKNMDFEQISQKTKKALKEAIARGGNRLIIDKSDDEEKNKDWLEKIHSNKKNYEDFRKQFDLKINTVISPVFHKMRNEIEEKINNISVDLVITDTKSIFSVKDAYGEKEAIIKITDPGFSKVVIDCSSLKLGEQKAKKISLDISDFNEGNLEKIISEIVAVL